MSILFPILYIYIYIYIYIHIVLCTHAQQNNQPDGR